MGYIIQCKNLMHLLVLLALIICLVGVSVCEGRPLSAEVWKIRGEYSMETRFMSLGTRLPKGQPVPPSGPSPDIN
ncbi:hypothetical protein Pint_02232 [Pistacia integerrima]|uniref:Uncharacterized protein n=1 Tax=Pistacia integerrima TaxID=434235 RepID=A0ACC0ZDV7_9ROSI|nr:hypothetical protein Pint_02232 [Pistacia integerrima]